MSAPDTHDSITVFVVDDEPLLLDLAKTILNPLGYNIQIFSDPRKALAAYPKAKPALVVTDYAMPWMTGLEVIRECRRIHPDQKTILLSGTVDEMIYASEPEPTRPNQFLAKPYQVRDFIQAVQKLATS
ncbi:MAG TPA: response regulator [Verrucomicrobiae bacterium]|jgi:CheY-like chemotaxis protein